MEGSKVGAISVFGGLIFIRVFLWPRSYLILWSICLGLVLRVGGKRWEVDIHYEALGST